MTGYVYAIGNENIVKIGFSLRPDRRLSKVSSDSPLEVNLLGFVPGGRDKELALHNKFSSYRVNGEWFRNEGDVAIFVATLPKVEAPRKIVRNRHVSALSEWMNANQMTETKFSSLVGVTQGTISRILNGKNLPDWKTMEAIFLATSGLVTPNDFAGNFLKRVESAK